MGKATRDVLFKVMSSEKKDKKLRILNYLSGPLDAAKVEVVMTSSETKVYIRKSFKSMKGVVFVAGRERPRARRDPEFELF